jgi:cytochrome c
MGLSAQLAGNIRLILFSKESEMARKSLSVLAATLLSIHLYGCQPDTPSKQATESSTAIPPPVATSQVSSPAQVSTQTATAVPAAKQEPITGVPGAKERDLAQKSGCFACHLIDKKLVGPAWNDVAAKYRGQKDAEAKLIAKVSRGGSGVWGAVPMPPNSPKVSEGDIKILVHFILSLK